VSELGRLANRSRFGRFAPATRSSRKARRAAFHTESLGAALGEAPLFDGGGYIASAVALEPTRVLFLPRGVLIDLCHRRPTVALAILTVLARRVRDFASLVSDLAFRPVGDRLARHLTAATAEPIKLGTSINLALTQSQLAARLGAVRELVARVFSQLERSGVISRERSRLTILDPERLAALARGDEETTTTVTLYRRSSKTRISTRLSGGSPGRQTSSSVTSTALHAPHESK